MRVAWDSSQSKCGCTLVDHDLIFQEVQGVREEEWYWWSAKHAGTLWETTYIWLIRKYLPIYPCDSGTETPSLWSSGSPLFQIESSSQPTKAAGLSRTWFQIFRWSSASPALWHAWENTLIMIRVISLNNPCIAVCHDSIWCSQHFPCGWFSLKTLSPIEGQHSQARKLWIFFSKKKGKHKLGLTNITLYRQKQHVEYTHSAVSWCPEAPWEAHQWLGHGL